MTRRFPLVAIGIGLCLSAGPAFVMTGCRALGSDDPSAATTSAPAADTELVAVTRQDVDERQKAEARVGNGAILTLPLEVAGIVTWAPDQGEVLRSGDAIVEVGGRPVLLVIGESPLYRPLRLVSASERDEAGTRVGRLQGQDVIQLQQFLLDAGHNDKGRLSADGEFGLSTQRAVKEWQRGVGHPATGVVDTSQMVFMATPLLAASQLVVGQMFEHFDVSGTETVLQIIGSTTLREFFLVGNTVEVLVDPPVTAVVSRSLRISGEGGVEQLIEITVDPNTDADFGQSVQVIGSVSRAEDVLTVPVRALLADSDGRWLVEVDSPTGLNRVVVELIDVVDITAIVSGLDEGDRVVVPL